MINIKTLKKLGEGDGLTLRHGHIINYKTGWQVADYGIETTDIHEAMQEVKRLDGNCGIWLENGVYYIDHSYRVDTKHKALEIGRQYNQISVFGWASKKLAYC